MDIWAEKNPASPGFLFTTQLIIHEQIIAQQPLTLSPQAGQGNKFQRRLENMFHRRFNQERAQ